ncbi:MAG: hypothetical protein ACXVH2_09185 [Methanobacterium sp.]|jgi:hypothetical protein
MTLEELFSNESENIYEIYLKIISLLEDIGPLTIEIKKTSIHFLNKSIWSSPSQRELVGF